MFNNIINRLIFQANRHVGDLFIDLQDGLNLISLLEVLSGDQLVSNKLRVYNKQTGHYKIICVGRYIFFCEKKCIYMVWPVLCY